MRTGCICDRCDKLPFTAGENREAIESQLPAVRFAIVARLRGTASLPLGQGVGTWRSEHQPAGIVERASP
jgi:hypothetical protein